LFEIKHMIHLTQNWKQFNFNFLCDQNFNANDQTIDVYHIHIYWSENENNGLRNHGKKFRVEMLYVKSELKQLKFGCTHELHY
jgi:hypothetical protein